MRISLPSVFGVTVVAAWLGFGIFGDHNTYIVHRDGTRIVKDYATGSDRIIGGLIFGLPFALLDTALLWAWQRARQARTTSSHEPSVSPHIRTL
jgi:hypothetical protein